MVIEKGIVSMLVIHLIKLAKNKQSNEEQLAGRTLKITQP